MLSTGEMNILNQLRSNARESLTELSKKTQIPISTIYTKLVKFRNGVIRKHTSLLNFRALGYHTIALMFLSSTEPEQLRHYLVTSAQINSVFKLNSEYQFMVEGIFEHLSDVDAFLERLETKLGRVERKLFYIVDEYQREGFMADERFL